MPIPIFHPFIAPDMAAAKPLAAFTSALDLASRLGGGLTVMIGVLRLTIPNLLSSATVQGLLAEEHRRAGESADQASRQIDGLAAAAKVPVSTSKIEGDFGQLRSAFASRARVHGLAFAETGLPGELLGEAVLESLLFESGRPVLVVPNGHGAAISLDRVVIAWDGSAGAARAVWDSVPLLKLASAIDIVTVTGEKDLQRITPAEALATSLAFLGKTISVTSLSFDNGTAAKPIKDHAARTGAGLVVQGAYGRSRWSEFVLGGVTRDMLRDNPLPVLMSH